MTAALHPDARAFLEGPATQAQLGLLRDLPAAALSKLLVRLAELGAATHLELLGEAPLPKPLRKEARRLAYGLRSRGVMPGPRARVAQIDREEPVALEAVALTLSPGLHGRYWFLLGALPGISSLDVRGGEHGGLEHIEVLPPVSASKLKKLASGASPAQGRGLPFVASADLTVCLLDRFAAGHERAAPLPPAWREVALWRETALALGADPSRADATRLLASELALEPLEASWRESTRLLEVEAAGSHLPPGPVVTQLLAAVIDLAQARRDHGEPSFQTALHELADAACDAWLEAPATRARVASLARAVADVLCGAQKRSEALDFLRISEVLERTPTPGSEVGLLRASFRQLVDHQLAQKLYGPARGPGVAP